MEHLLWWVVGKGSVGHKLAMLVPAAVAETEGNRGAVVSVCVVTTVI